MLYDIYIIYKSLGAKGLSDENLKCLSNFPFCSLKQKSAVPHDFHCQHKIFSS